MAVTIGAWSSIDDTEIDAESPITESLMVRNRDNSYWIDAGTRRTEQTSTTKVLTPDGSGGVAWVEVGDLAGVDGTKGTINLTGSPQTITALTTGFLRIEALIYGVGSGGTYLASSSAITIDLSDDTFAGVAGYTEARSGPAYVGAASVSSGTLTSSMQTIAAMKTNLQAHRSGGNVQVQGIGVLLYTII